MEDLKSLVRNSREQCDPIRLARGCTRQYQYYESSAVFVRPTKRTAYTPEPAIQTWCPTVANRQNPHLASSKAVEPNPLLRNHQVNVDVSFVITSLVRTYRRKTQSQRALTPTFQLERSSIGVTSSKSRGKTSIEQPQSISAIMGALEICDTQGSGTI